MLELSVKQFLEATPNDNTRKLYRVGIKKFSEYLKKTPEDILQMRKDDLTQRPDENIVDFRNRAARFEKLIEDFYNNLVKEGYSINSARSMTIGIRQLFDIIRCL